MYQKYQTEALVLGSREFGESDKTYALFTQDFGRVAARASAVRREGSKMRYALQNYSRANVSLVKGKRGWRVAGASAIQTAIGADATALGAFARISELVTRLVAGEEENEYLFTTLSEAHEALLGGEDAPTIEILCVARVLYTLGYISSEALDTALFSHTSYGREEIREAHMLKDKLLSSINSAMSETHL